MLITDEAQDILNANLSELDLLEQKYSMLSTFISQRKKILLANEVINVPISNDSNASTRKRYTAEQRDIANRLIRQGASCSETAEKSGIKIKTIYNMRKDIKEEESK